MRLRNQDKAKQGQEVELLETNEQIQLIDNLKDQAKQQDHQLRMTFFFLFLILSFLFTFCCVHFFFDPWSLPHQDTFKSAISESVFPIFYVISAVVSLYSALICKFGRRSLSPIISIVIWGLSLLILCYWGYLFLNLQIQSFLLYWLPFGNIVCLLLAVYVDQEMISLVGDVNTLDSLVYTFKSA